MEGAGSSSTKAMSHAARTTARKHLYESIVATAQALVAKTTNPDIIQGCSAAIALYTTRITEIRKQRGQGRKDRKRRAIAKSKARIHELEATMGEALDHLKSRSEGSQDNNADDDEDHDDASHENVKEFFETWANCHDVLQATGGNATAELARVNELWSKDMPLPKGSVATWLAAYEAYKEEADKVGVEYIADSDI